MKVILVNFYVLFELFKITLINKSVYFDILTDINYKLDYHNNMINKYNDILKNIIKNNENFKIIYQITYTKSTLLLITKLYIFNKLLDNKLKKDIDLLFDIFKYLDFNHLIQFINNLL